MKAIITTAYRSSIEQKLKLQMENNIKKIQFSTSAYLLTILCYVLLFSSCAEVQHNVKPCLVGQTYGFWGGLWHGIIAPFAWIGSLFRDDIAVWAVNNDGGWYTFGFILGIGALTGGGSKVSSKKTAR